MASGPLTYVTMVVFSPEKFQGNPLALVSVHGNALSQKRKAQFAREFKFSETVFLHDAPGPGQPRLLEIFTETGEELPFAGHPIIGTAHYIFNYLEKINYDVATRDSQKQTTTLLTKAGRIPIFFNPYRQVAACVVPTNYHVHSKKVDIEKIISTQPHVQIVPTIDKERGRTFPLVSIVKGMTFVLVDLTDNPEIFAALQAGKSPEVELDDEWAPSFVGCMYYKVLAKSEVPGEPAIHNIQARMISHGIEDPGTGSACSALSCYLALHSQSQEAASEQKTNPPEASTQPAASTEEGKPTADLVKKTEDLKVGDAKIERKVFGIQQGAEMGRLCTIAVEVDVKTEADGKKSIASVILSGRANLMLKGEVIGF
ncbi:phenazine biosynthesis-like protein [Cladophialophora carrionii]|uniref:Phenazine biosynthesis-like protein n=1 Tax=Cladophialophora carrionii TaxID=86049 RepID=A0A1C1CQW5_9EURO|nr:phenazine biosynthesis-like protein [Cladophialophora carrionii]